MTANGSPVRAAPGDNRLTDADSAAPWSIVPGALRHGYVEVAPGEHESRGEVTDDQ